jgi:uncharacterized protein
MLTKDVIEFIKKQKLGYIATVNSDNTPNLSPKGSFTVWDENQLIFADINSPETIRNLLINPHAEINFVDIFKRRGYLIRGVCKIIPANKNAKEYAIFYDKAGYAGYVDKIKNYVLIEIKEIAEIYSPAYDNGETETTLEKYFRHLYL